MTMRKAHTYRVGHPSYTFPNHPVIVAGHAQAIRELRSRGCKRDDARMAIQRADEGSHAVCTAGALGFQGVEVVAISESLSDLTRELATFCRSEGLEHKSASDLVYDENLTIVQRNYLLRFIRRWEAAEDAERVGA
jgi:hypothetical protein